MTVRTRDQGVGLSPELLPRVFDMFTQGEDNRERAQGGLGIGLTLVRNLVELHGGSVQATSEGPGCGSEFVVVLPTAATGRPERSDSSPGYAASAMPTQECKRILLADDNVDAAESMAQLLRLGGDDVQIVYDGLAVVEAAAADRPDIVLLDLGMPVMNGLEACRRIRAQAWATDTLIVALTGWGQDTDRRKSHEAGFDGHLVKPVSLRRVAAGSQPRNGKRSE